MRRALILVLACSLAGCSLTGPTPDAGAGMGDGGVTESNLAAPQAAASADAAPPARPEADGAPASVTAGAADAGTAGADNPILAAIAAVLPGAGAGASEVQVASPDTPHPAPRPAAASGGVIVPALSSVAAGDAGAGTAPAVQVATPDTPHPKPRPAVPDTAQAGAEPAAAAPPPKPKSTLQIRCEASGGVWGQVGNSDLYICQKKTRDGGKVCHKKSDCQGECLAGVGTCAPVEPLLGCNDVLDAQGRRTTLCLN